MTRDIKAESEKTSHSHKFGNSREIQNSKIILLFSVFFATLLLFPQAVSADSYVGGKPPETIHDGVVSGGLWFDSLHGPAGSSGQPNSIEKEFSIPEFDNIEWARLYVVVYCGNMQKNYEGIAEVSFNGGEGTRILGTEILDREYVFEMDGGTTPVEVNGHCNRVSSDYLMWYDVADAIKSGDVTAYVSTDKAPGYTGTFDGRIKILTLVVAYNDGDNDEVYYWVNQGHDVHSYYVEDDGKTYEGKTSFDTTDLPEEFSEDPAAYLSAVHLASENGIYTFNNGYLDSNPSQGGYSGSQTWDVTDSVTDFRNSVMTYSRDVDEGAFYKIILAMLSVRYPGEDAGDITVQSIPSGAEIILDGDKTGFNTNFTIKSVETGEHKVSVSLEGYKEPDERTVNVQRGEESVSVFKLVPLTGSVSVSSEPSGAKIYLDGTDTGKITDSELEEILVGEHTVSVSLGGYEPSSKEITVDEDETTDVSFTLTPITNGNEDGTYGYSGKKLNEWKTETLNGGLIIADSGSYSGLLDNGDSKDYQIKASIPENASLKEARLYIYYTWSHDTDKRTGLKPSAEVLFDGSLLLKDASYSDRKGEGVYDYLVQTECFDVTEKFDPENGNLISVKNQGGEDTAFAVYGALLAVVYEDPDAPLITYWIDEGCDAVLASDQFETTSEQCTTTAKFSGNIIQNSINQSSLIIISTAATGENDEDNKIIFNGWEWQNYLKGGASSISQATLDAKALIKNTENLAEIQSYIATENGDYLENRNAFLVVEYDNSKTAESIEEEIKNEYEDLYNYESTEFSPSSSPGSYPAKYLITTKNGYSEPVQITHDNGTLTLIISQGSRIEDSFGYTVNQVLIREETIKNETLWKYTIGPIGSGSDIPIRLNGAFRASNSGTDYESDSGEYEYKYSLLRHSSEEETEEISATFIDGSFSALINNFGTYELIRSKSLINQSDEKEDATPESSQFYKNLFLNGINYLFNKDVIGNHSATEILYNKSKEKGNKALIQTRENISCLYEKAVVRERLDLSAQLFNLSVYSNPSGAGIYVDGDYTGKTTPVVINDLAGGKHSISLISSGYKTLVEKIFLTGDSELTFDLDSGNNHLLEEKKDESIATYNDLPDVGGIYVTSSIEGADVYIDGYNTGMTTPAVFNGLGSGKHTVKIKKGKIEFNNDKIKIQVVKNRITRVQFDNANHYYLNAEVVSDSYEDLPFTVNGRPPEYEIPKTAEVNLGYSFITILNNGTYLSHSINVFSDDETEKINPRDYRFGKVFVDSVPAGAEIYVDGFATGYSTPYSIDNISDGRHIISVSRPGYIDEEKEILFAPDISDIDKSVKFILKPYLYGSLEVTSTPPGAKIYLYGKNTGEVTPQIFRYMDLGAIDIRIVGDNNAVLREDVIIEPYSLTRCNVTLSG
ncbi:DUF3344 domain-containing protein [Methanoplanus limicola]|uniref:PEGA domain protein n=1 Tax=Methanoplanus limicola DSM 2279 TaxID=937775 RepID=H1Z419_9EURY|nr:DUF3344 domain-containing protein [Methanoplanus limicola]EHQ35698.1 PEGA domain protein [Methanoplanus limicola DSM 2279]